MSDKWSHKCKGTHDDRFEVLCLSSGWKLNITFHEWTRDDESEAEIESDTEVFVPIQYCPFCGEEL